MTSSKERCTRPLASAHYLQLGKEPELGYSSPSSDEYADEQSDLDLSCSSSAFENDSDTVEEPESGTVEPYQYEPVANDASSGSDGEDVNSDSDDEERSRLSNTY